jgi:hypothetical protein
LHDASVAQVRGGAITDRRAVTIAVLGREEETDRPRGDVVARRTASTL